MGDNIVTRSLVAAIVTAAAVTVITLLIYPIYTIVVEDAGPLTALKKGINVAKSNFWITLGLFVVMIIVSLLISLIIGFIIGLITAPMPLGLSQVIIAIVNGAVQSYIPVVMMVAFMSFYMSLTAGGGQAPQESVQAPEM